MNLTITRHYREWGDGGTQYRPKVRLHGSKGMLMTGIAKEHVFSPRLGINHSAMHLSLCVLVCACVHTDVRGVWCS